MVSEKLLQQIETNCRTSFAGIYPKDYDFAAMARDFVDERRAREELQRLSTLLACELRGMSMLEIGSGYGMVVAVARNELGMEAFGIEPGEQFAGTYATGCELLRERGVPVESLRQARAENIHFENNRFDVVYSSNVIEHVQDPARVFAESIRTVKKGGHIVFIIPNYGSWWEGHYGFVVPPGSPAWLLKLIVKLSGRDPSFVDTLQLITYKKLRRWLEPHRDAIEVLGWGVDLWKERLRTLNFSEWAQLGKLKRILAPLHRFRLTGLAAILGTWLHWETPFVLVLRKK